MHIAIFSRNILINNRSNYIKFLELNEVFRLDDFWYTISPVIGIIFERNHQLEETSDKKKRKIQKLLLFQKLPRKQRRIFNPVT